MDNKTVLLLGSDNLNLLVSICDIADITNLTTRVTIEWGVVEYKLIRGVVLALYTTIASDADICLKVVVADKLALLDRDNLLPVVDILLCSITRTLLLHLQLLLKLLDIDLNALLLSDKLRKVDGEAVGIVQHEGILTRDFAPCRLLDNTLQEVDTRSEGTEE